LGHRLFAAIALFGLGVGTPARAQDGQGLRESSRISVHGGWQSALLAQGPAPATRSRGGPLAVATFGYSPLDWGELGIDLFAGGQPVAGQRGAPWAYAYGALVGGRLQGLLPGGLFQALIPRLGAHVGTAVVTSTGGGEDFVEVVGPALAASASLEARLDSHWALALEYRFLFAQGVLGEAEVFNGGGHSLLLGVTFSFPPGSRGTWSP
jgi:hypothetical protein